MQGFYITNGLPVSRTDFPDFLTEYKTELRQGILVSLYCNSHHLSYYEDKHGYIANNGSFIYKDKFNSEALKLFYEDLSFRKLEDLLQEVRGQFILIMYLCDEFILVTDKYRTIPVYRYRHKNLFAISNIYYLLTRARPKTKDGITLQQKTSFGWDYPIMTGRTLFKEIEILRPGTIYNLTTNKKQQYWCFSSIKYGKYKSYSQLIPDLEKEIDSIYKVFDNINGVCCDITGGMDTRLSVEKLCDKDNVLFLNDMNRSDRHLTVGGRYSEERIVDKIVSRLGISYTNLINKENERYKKWLVDNRVLIDKYLTCPVMSEKRFYYYMMCSRMGPGICVSGFIGTELMTGTPYHVKNAKAPFVPNRYTKVWQPYVDILHDSNKEEYMMDIGVYMVKMLSRCTSTDHLTDIDKYYTYLIYLTTYMESQAEYWNNANMVMPVYSPYFDLTPILLAVPMSMKSKYKIQRFLYEEIMRKELREVNTTHGFPSCKVTKKNFYRFLRLSSYNLQYYGAFDRTKQHIMDKLVYYSPYCKVLLHILSRFSGRDFSFLHREIESTDIIDQEKFNKALISKQLIDWIKRFDRQWRVFNDRFPS